jgi:hypothetical protein
MMKKKFIIFTVLLSIVWVAVAWAQFKDGLWEMTTQVEMKGMSQAMPPATFRQCITRSEPVPRNQDKNYACKTTAQKISGNTVSYSVECKGKDGLLLTTGKSTYSGSTMEGSSTTNFKVKGQPEMQMAGKIKGKYIGPCPK